MRVLFMIVGILCGWWIAHSEVATECRYQGNFYVGSTLYECKIKP